MKTKDTLGFETLLKENNFRVTKGRVEILSFLKRAKQPVTAKELQEAISLSLDKVTLYRALEDFVAAKLVQKVNLHNNSTYYELINEHHHHHHIICEHCGKLEDIEICNSAIFEKEVLSATNSFAIVNSHSLEFFGVCRSCHKV